MKNICFESYRQSKRDRMQLAKPKPKQLDPTWYTDNIYSNRSDDLDEDYIPDCLKYGTYRKLRNIREQDEREQFYGEDISFDGGAEGGIGGVGGVGGGGGSGGVGMRGRRIEGEGSPTGYNLQRSISCKEFQYPKSQSFSFGAVDIFDEDTPVKSSFPPLETKATTSILKNRGKVPKSYSFSATQKTTPFDVMDYDLPPTTNTRREKQEAFRKSMGYYGYSSSLDESALSHHDDTIGGHTCCAREHCTSAQCLLDEIYPTTGYGMRGTTTSGGTARGGTYSWRRDGLQPTPVGGGMYGAGASGGSNRNLQAALTADWMEQEERGNHRVAATASRYSLHREREQLQQPPPPPTVICCCAADDYCYHRQQQRHMARTARSRLHCPGHHPAAEEEEHMHCRALAYDTDLEHFIRDERERLMLQDKFLDDDERYLAPTPSSHYIGNYRRPARSKSLLEMQSGVSGGISGSRYNHDDDSCSDSTEMDLEDFNIDLEKYWEELEKPPSPIDLDMQRRNMHSNLKVKNVNVGCYNNGQPIDMHDREQERMMIKKSLLEGMPSPPQLDPHINNVQDFHFFEHAGSPLHRPFNYGHKVYPTPDTLPSYKFNNFYPEHSVQTQQPTSTGHHPSAGGHSALSLINNIFSIYKPNKYSPLNCQMNVESKPEPCKKMNVPSTRRPLGAPHSEYMHSMKRPLIVSTEQPHFKIIPEKTGLKISPLYSFPDYGDKPQTRHKLTSTARPLMLPH